MEEQWKPISEIPGYENFTNYELSNTGVLRRMDTKAVRKWIIGVRNSESVFLTNRLGKNERKKLSRKKSVDTLFPIDTEQCFCKLSDLQDYRNFPDEYEVMANGDIRCFNYRYAWNNYNGYESCQISRDGIHITIMKHRILALLYIPNPCGQPYVDHINHIRNDNRIENLRWVTASQNRQNTGLRSNNTSGWKNIYKQIVNGKPIWCVIVGYSYVNNDGKLEKHSKSKTFQRNEFDTEPPDDVVCYARSLREKLHGEFACHE